MFATAGSKPPHDFFVLLVFRANQGNEHTDSDQKMRHSSPPTICSVVMGSSAGPKSNIGIPSTCLMRGLRRVPRTISCETALLKVMLRLSAYCAAIAAASSSSDKLVLMSGLCINLID